MYRLQNIRLVRIYRCVPLEWIFVSLIACSINELNKYENKRRPGLIQFSFLFYPNLRVLRWFVPYTSSKSVFPIYSCFSASNCECSVPRFIHLIYIYFFYLILTNSRERWKKVWNSFKTKNDRCFIILQTWGVKNLKSTAVSAVQRKFVRDTKTTGEFDSICGRPIVETRLFDKNLVRRSNRPACACAVGSPNRVYHT